MPPALKKRERDTSLCGCWSGFRGGGADADDARSQMPIEDDETICAAERKGSPCTGCARASSAVPCDREPGALRLAAVEPEEADG